MSQVIVIGLMNTVVKQRWKAFYWTASVVASPAKPFSPSGN